ncbi:hypothetical protein N7501_002603, partial [Penicillium viridicatum]
AYLDLKPLIRKSYFAIKLATLLFFYKDYTESSNITSSLDRRLRLLYYYFTLSLSDFYLTIINKYSIPLDTYYIYTKGSSYL